MMQNTSINNDQVDMFAKFKTFAFQQAENHQQNLRLFVIGAVLFFIGAGIIIFANNSIAPSLKQELTALAGTALAGLGIIIAALGYIALSVLRFFKMMSKDQPMAKSTAHPTPKKLTAEQDLADQPATENEQSVSQPSDKTDQQQI